MVLVGTFSLLNIPYIQREMAVVAADELSSMFGTEVTIGRINAGFINRIIIDDLTITDRLGAELCKVSRLSAKFDIIPLLRGRISIGSLQLFGFNINLNKPTPEADANFKFIIDALASPDSVQQSSNIDLRINSILIRRGRVAYDVLSTQETPGKFNPQHMKFYNVIGNISLKAFQNDSINAQIKRFSVDEQSGLELRRLTMKIQGNENKMTVENFEVDLPATSLKMDTIKVNYDSLGSFQNFMTDVNFSFRTFPSYITLNDLSPFIPALSNFRERIDLELRANGTLDRLNCPSLMIRAGNHLRINGDVQLQDLSNPVDAFIYGNLTNFSANSEGLSFLARNLSDNYSATPALLERLKNISFSGQITGYFTDLVTYGTLRTDLGNIKGDVKFSSDKESGTFSYSGGIESENFHLGNWLANDKLGDISYVIDVQSDHYRDRYPHIILKGIVQSIQYSDYQYENILLDGEYKDGGFDGAVEIDDDNGKISLNGNINLSQRIPVFDFNADIKKVRPHDLKLTDKYEDTEFSMKLNANFTGGNIDEIIGTISIDSVSMSAPDRGFYTSNIRMAATRTADKNRLTLNSEFIRAELDGKYSYSSLKNSFLKVVGQYVPSLYSSEKDILAGKNDFSFNINLYNTEVLPIVFDIPFSIYTPSSITGFFDDQDNRLMLEAYFPRMSYGNFFLESGLIRCENTTDNIQGLIRFANHRKSGVVNLSMDLLAANNQLATKINWGNNAETTYSGHFEAIADFFKREDDDDKLSVNIDIKPTEVILNDTLWNIHPSKISINPELIHIDHFLFSKENQHLLIDGYASDDMTSSIRAELNNISIGYVFDIVNLKSVDFNGLATGEASIHRALKDPIMNTNLLVKNFNFNNVNLGDMNIYGEWDQNEQGIYLKAHIKEKDIAESDVEGYIFPLKPKSGLDLKIKARNTNVSFIQEYLDNITSKITGRAHGDVHFYGGFKSLNIEGNVKANATFKVDILNTNFTLNDSIHMTQNQFLFRNAEVFDPEGHRGLVNGEVNHRNFKDMTYNFQINTNNLLVMHTEEDPELPFYGTIYGTGNARLRGDGQELRLDAAITTNRNTNFIYSLAESATATSNQFIKFVDKTPIRTFHDSIPVYSDFELAQQRSLQADDDSETDMHLNISVDATPDATLRIIMDPVSGDYISGRGSGNMRIEYFNKGDIKMFGNYVIDQGIYKFSLQEVIRKDFNITAGSNITFNGDPTDATLDIQAVYTVNSASLTDLIPDNPELIKRRNVRVNSLMNISGNLERPTIRMAIELPNEREEIQGLVRNYVSTEEEVNMQILYLLGIGKFYTPENLSSGQTSNMMTSVLSSTLSGQLNNIFSQFMDNKNWNFGTNVSTGERGWTDVEIEGILSAQLLNNRLIINGNFGYRENPLSDTNFVGDFDAQWLLVPSGDLRLKAYNQTNDRFITRTNLTTQGIGILFKRDFDRWSELLFWNTMRNRKKKAEAEAAEKK